MVAAPVPAAAAAVPAVGVVWDGVAPAAPATPVPPDVPDADCAVMPIGFGAPVPLALAGVVPAVVVVGVVVAGACAPVPAPAESLDVAAGSELHPASAAASARPCSGWDNFVWFFEARTIIGTNLGA